ncbi:MAG: polymerase ECF-subfamily sigma factor [Thermoleophilia bacterium]|nr:polymerase ECF-subfamily sigma factor [Thermoleophilia bacterium]
MTDFDSPAGTISAEVPTAPAAALEARVEAIISDQVATLQRIAAARVGPALADDVVAETFTVVWMQVSGGRPVDDIDRAWLVGILLNRCRMHRRAERRWRQRQLRGQVFQDAGADHAGGISGAASRVDAQQLSPHLLRAFAKLSDSERTAIALVAWGDLTPTEAAAAMGLPAATVRSHLHRGRQRLAATIDSHTTPAQAGTRHER